MSSLQKGAGPGDDHSHDHGHDSEHAHIKTPQPAAYGAVSQHDSHSPHGNDQMHPSKEVDVNIEAAYLHVVTDLIQSIGVALAGLVIWICPTMQVFDPICTFLFSGLVMW